MVGKRGAASYGGQIAGNGIGRLGIIQEAAASRSASSHSTLDDESDLLHSRAAAQQVRRCSSLSVSSWGEKAKRTRTAVGRWTDWASIGDGPAGLIAERVLADEVADYVRFRAVCLAWRRCCAGAARGALEDRRFRPRRWIMLLGHKETLDVDGAPHRSRRNFLNTSTGQCVWVEVPELRDHGVLRSTTDGLLVLVRKATGNVRVLNPLTRQTAELPPLTTLELRPGYFDRSSHTVGLVDDGCTFMLCYSACGRVRTIACARPGDERWALVRTHDNIIDALTPTMSFAGRFYGVSSDAVVTVDCASGRLVVAAKLSRPFQRMVDTMHLVDNGGELMLVHRMLRRRAYPATLEPSESRRHYRWAYKVYRVDLEAGKATPARGLLGGRAVFIGGSRALSVSPRVFPSVDANTVYPGLALDERGGDVQIGAYHLISEMGALNRTITTPRVGLHIPRVCLTV